MILTNIIEISKKSYLMNKISFNYLLMTINMNYNIDFQIFFKASNEKTDKHIDMTFLIFACEPHNYNFYCDKLRTFY